MQEIILPLAGAIMGGLGGTFAGYYLKEKRRKQQINELLVTQYLSQFQFHVESLWYRLNNITRGGKRAMSEEYFIKTTLYSLAAFLAYKQIMILEGIYAQIELLDLKLESGLKNKIQRVGNRLDNIGYHLETKLYNYDRQALGESVLDKTDGTWNVSQFIKFQKDYFDGEEHLEIKAGIKFVKALRDKEIEGELKKEIVSFMNEIAEIVIELTVATKIEPGKTLKKYKKIPIS